MADKTKIPRAKALALAEKIVAQLQPLCERIEIAGSIRRGKPFVSDIEILYIPKMGSKPDGLFGEKPCGMADEQIEAWLKDAKIAKRPRINGATTWGEKNKLAMHVATAVAIDFFATSEANWWVSLVVRTGSKETNLSLTTGAQRQSKSLNAYGCGVTNEDGTITPATSEEEVFALCGVKYLEPDQR